MAYSRPRTTGTITLSDMKAYLTGLAQRNASARAQPYTFWSSGKQGASLTQSQLASAMRNFGYSNKQIRQAQTGNWGQGGIGGVLRSVSGALVGLGPEFPAASSTIDAIFGAGEVATLETPKTDVTPVRSRVSSTGDIPVKPTEITPTEVPKDTTDTTPPDTTTEPTIKRSIGQGVRGLVPTLPTTTTGTGLLDGITSSLDFLKWIAWLFHPLNILRAVEFITGLATMFYGTSILMGVMRRGQATHRTTLRSIFAATPIGRAAQFRRARRRGRRAGEVQAERDVAYRGARQERARSVGAERRRLGETGGTGGTGGVGTGETQVA